MQSHLRLSFKRIAVDVGSVIPKVSQSDSRCFTRPLARSLPRWPELFGLYPPALPSNQRALRRPVASLTIPRIQKLISVHRLPFFRSSLPPHPLQSSPFSDSPIALSSLSTSLPSS